MFNLSEQFHEQYSRFQQQQFDQWTPFEQFYASIELSKKLQLSYRYFLSQFVFHVNLQLETNDMFNHTVHQANTPAILACLLCDPLDTVIFTLQLYLPLLSLKTTNEKLLEAYRDVFIYLDSKLTNPANFSYTEQQLIQFCQQIRYFIQNNPCLHKFLVTIPQLTALATSHTNTIQQGTSDEQHHQPLQRYPSGRSYSHTTAPLMNISSEDTQTSPFSQQLIRNDASDSGVDLTGTGMNNSVQNLLTHPLVGRSNSTNLILPNGQDNLANHPFVGKTASSPIPEQAMSHTRHPMVPLSAVLSAPAPSMHSYYSDFCQSSTIYPPQQLQPTLTISDEGEQESHVQNNYLDRPIEMFLAEMTTNDTIKRLGQFRSLRNRNTRMNEQTISNNAKNVSQYLDVDGNADSIQNTFMQANSGMRDVPKWLKNLRLHKYAFFFSQMTYDQMMNLTFEQLKEGQITDGACTKILLNIKKLKERATSLQKCLLELDHEQIEMKNILQQLHELMLTPIRAKQTESESDIEEDLPKLIMQVLEKVYQRLTVNTSATTTLSDMCNNLVGLFDRCYKHEAFSAAQRHTLLHWRGPLCTKLQTSGKIEYKSMQSSSSSSSINRRVQLKPQTSMGNLSTTQITQPAGRSMKNNSSYYSNYPSSSVPLSRQHHSDTSNPNDSSPSHNTKSSESNIIRRPIRSPTLIFPTNNDVANEHAMSPSSHHHLSIAGRHSLQEQAANSFITERSGFGTGNFRPSFQYQTSTPQRPNGAYLAANQHQLLTRKTSIDPYGESATHDKKKLGHTFSDPNKIRFYSPTHLANHQSSSTCSPVSCQQTAGFGTMSASYSAQSTYLSRSSTSVTNDHQNTLESSSRETYPDKETSIFYEESDKTHINGSSPSSDNAIHDQRHNSNEFDIFCRQITDSAIGDDVHDSSMDPTEEFVNVQPKQSSSNSSTDIEQ